jgi:hypothetical protein
VTTSDDAGTPASNTDTAPLDEPVEAPAGDYQDAAKQARIRHATLRYNTLRLAFLLVALAVLWLVRVKGVLLVALALLISGLASYVFLRKQRTLMLEQISTGIERRRRKSAVRSAREDSFQLAQDDDPPGGAE